MKMKLILMLFIVTMTCIHAKTRVYFRLLDFINSSSKDYDGSCCDTWMFGCTNECENWFNFCFKKGTARSSEECLLNVKTYVLSKGDDSFQFPGYGKPIGPNLKNPIEFVYDGSFNGFGLFAQVYDDDSGNFLGIGKADDFIDKLYKNVAVKPGLTDKDIVPVETKFYGRRIMLRIQTWAYCEKDWYNVDCNTYCVARDDNTGHYTCDKKTGNKKCNIGWTGPSCNEPKCSNCNMEHANCTSPGVCICLSGWKSVSGQVQKCDACTKKVGCTDNGYCIKGNDCHCNSDWLGDLCDKDNNTCRSSPCQNAGVCVYNGVNQHLCNCVPGYTGANCETEIDACASKPCQHNALCLNRRTDYICQCPAGYNGKNCENNIDECVPNRCRNGATCIDGVYQFNCSCVPGYSGQLCNTDINECLNNSCQHNSVCKDEINGYSCLCTSGYNGTFCEIDIDDCIPNKCQNGGMCIDKINSFECQCLDGFNGTTCNNNNDECQSNLCLPNGRCTDLVNNYTCTCNPGFSGRNCEINMNDCLPGICHNGTCFDQINGYKCECKQGFEGVNCTKNINDCKIDPCINGALCVDEIHDYSCTCKPGWTGKNCSQNINDCNIPCNDQINCVTSPCQNGALCNDLVNNFTCDCSIGYEGRYCEKRIDHCSNSPCQYGGSCINRLDGYVCACDIGYTGQNCSIDIDECSSQPCDGNGTKRCDNRIGSFKCICKQGYAGVLCSENIDECDPRFAGNVAEGGDISTGWGFCGQHGECVDGIVTFTCKCKPGYEGTYCQKDINECKSQPCLNGATCFQNSGKAGYFCQCKEGFNGTNCEIDVNECAFNNVNCKLSTSQCVDQVNGYSCNCSKGWKGIDCSSTSSWCENNNTCNQNGVCIDHKDRFECKCNEGYTGERCDQDVDECLDNNLCKDGSKCANTIGNFTCYSCPPGKTGRNCETEIDDCDNVNCFNNFTCVDKTASFECNCPSDTYTKPLCEDKNECELSPTTCPIDRICKNTIGGYQCDCLPGWTGNDCKTSVDDCAENNCTPAHLDRCIDRHRNFTCQCFGRWTGRLCNKKNMSLEDPCGCEEGACYKTEDGSKECKCNPEYKGDKCTVFKAFATTDKKKQDGVFMKPFGIGLLIGGICLLIIICVALLVIFKRRKAPGSVVDECEEKMTNTKVTFQQEEVKFEGGELMFHNPTFSLGRNNPGLVYQE